MTIENPPHICMINTVLATSWSNKQAAHMCTASVLKTFPPNMFFVLISPMLTTMTQTQSCYSYESMLFIYITFHLHSKESPRCYVQAVSLCSLGKAYNESYVQFGKKRQINFCNKVFSAWDFNITDANTAKLKKVQIKTDLQVGVKL